MVADFISVKDFSRAVLFSLLVVGLVVLHSTVGNTGKVVFCDVGQGDAAYIRTTDGTDILVDAGPGRGVLSCLGRHMPFYDRTLELVFMTHPQYDHYGGFGEVVDRYTIERFIAPPVDNPNKSFNALKQKIHEQAIPVYNAHKGDRFRTGDDWQIVFLWPTREYIADKSGLGSLSENVLGAFTTTEDLNAYSEVFLFSHDSFDVLFTGDITKELLDNLKTTFQDIEILKVPHHGSKNGLTLDFLKKVNPELSVISVSATNSYGHPSRLITDMFDDLGKQYLTTAKHGDVVIEFGDDGWRVR